MNESIEPAWEKCLQRLDARDGVVEIATVPGRRDDAVMTDVAEVSRPPSRVRVLAYRPGGIVVDRPGSEDAAECFAPGALVSLLAMEGQTRWQMMTRVLGQATFRLNDQSVAPSLMLARPHEVHSAQRRAFFRASTAGVRVEPVDLTPLAGQASADEGLGVVAEQPRQFKATMLNIGGGGMGVESPQHVSHQLALGQRYRCEVKLPVMGITLQADVVVVHLERNPDGTHYLGLQFEMADRSMRDRLEDQICQFTTWMQRQHLQRINQKR